nr:uncharacterized protein LOC109149242 [Ipomoea batatas]
MVVGDFVDYGDQYGGKISLSNPPRYLEGSVKCFAELDSDEWGMMTLKEKIEHDDPANDTFEIPVELVHLSSNELPGAISADGQKPSYGPPPKKMKTKDHGKGKAISASQDKGKEYDFSVILLYAWLSHFGKHKPCAVKQFICETVHLVALAIKLSI